MKKQHFYPHVKSAPLLLAAWVCLWPMAAHGAETGEMEQAAQDFNQAAQEFSQGASQFSQAAQQSSRQPYSGMEEPRQAPAQPSAPVDPRNQALTGSPQTGYAGTWTDPETGDIITSVIAPTQRQQDTSQSWPIIVEPQVSPDWGSSWQQGSNWGNTGWNNWGSDWNGWQGPQWPTTPDNPGYGPAAPPPAPRPPQFAPGYYPPPPLPGNFNPAYRPLRPTPPQVSNPLPGHNPGGIFPGEPTPPPGWQPGVSGIKPTPPPPGSNPGQIWQPGGPGPAMPPAGSSSGINGHPWTPPPGWQPGTSGIKPTPPPPGASLGPAWQQTIPHVLPGCVPAAHWPGWYAPASGVPASRPAFAPHPPVRAPRKLLGAHSGWAD